MKMRELKWAGVYELDVGNNTAKIIVTSENNSMQKIYEINVYRKTREETDEDNQIQEEGYQKAQELISKTETHENSMYNTDKTNLVVEYKSNNEIIKMGILLSILFILSIIVVLKNTRNNNKKQCLKKK